MAKAKDIRATFYAVIMVVIAALLFWDNILLKKEIEGLKSSKPKIDTVYVVGKIKHTIPNFGYLQSVGQDTHWAYIDKRPNRKIYVNFRGAN